MSVCAWWARPEVKILKISGTGIFVVMLQIVIFLGPALPWVSFSFPQTFFMQNLGPDRLSYVRTPQKFLFARY